MKNFKLKQTFILGMMLSGLVFLNGCLYFAAHDEPDRVTDPEEIEIREGKVSR